MSVSQEMRAGEVILFYLRLAYASCLCVLAFGEGQKVTAGNKKGSPNKLNNLLRSFNHR